VLAACVASLLAAGPASGSAANFEGASTDGTAAFFETTDSLVAADTDTAGDVYERSGGVTRLASRGPVNGNGDFPADFEADSASGSKVFFSTDERLVNGDTDSQRDIYERDLGTGTTTLVSTGPDGGNGAFGVFFDGISNDGSCAAFDTDESLVAGDSDGNHHDLYENCNGTTSWISQGDGTSANQAFDAFTEGNFRDDSTNQSFISNDGNRVFFETDEKLVAADTDASQDVYVRSGGTTSLVSIGPNGGNNAFDAALVGTSDDGTRAFFVTQESLISGAGGDGDTNLDIYERNGTTTSLISTGPDDDNTTDADAIFEQASADGTKVAFDTADKLLSTDTDGKRDVYERSGTTTTQVSVGPNSTNGAFDAFSEAASSDLSRIFFSTFEPFASGDTDTSEDVYERVPATTTTEQVSVGPNGFNGADNAFMPSGVRAVSSDGTHAAVTTNEHLVSSDTDSANDIYIRDLSDPNPVNHTTAIATLGPSGGNSATQPTIGSRGIGGWISDTGSHVFFNTQDALTANDVDSDDDVYDFTGGAPVLVSVDPLPVTTIDSGPSGPTRDTTPTFTFHSEPNSTFQCKVDAAAFGPCTSPFTAPALSDATHTFQVQATDSGGQLEATPVSRSFRVDTDPPQTTITSAPKASTTDRTPTFRFKSDEPGRFKCKVDHHAFRRCTSPKTLGTLAFGFHTFKVKAIDRAGNPDPTPAHRSFTVHR
jgi:hypothetical protein